MRSTSTGDLGAHILVADDESSIVGLLATVLVGAGYQVTAMRGVRHAIELLAQNRQQFAAAVLDAGTEPGQDVVQAVRTRQPNLPLLVTGATVVCDRVTGFLPKPFRAEGLLKAVKDILSGP